MEFSPTGSQAKKIYCRSFKQTSSHCEVVDVYKYRPVIRFTICIANHRRAGPMKRCVAVTKAIGYLFMVSVRGFTPPSPI